MNSVITSVIVTFTVPIPSPSPATTAYAEPPRPLPVLDKAPRYKCHLSAYAGPSAYGDHELYISEDQYIRMLRIAHESRRNP